MPQRIQRFSSSAAAQGSTLLFRLRDSDAGGGGRREGDGLGDLGFEIVNVDDGKGEGNDGGEDADGGNGVAMSVCVVDAMEG
mmetsp:Transcript_32640/g.59189  ORF Transcript_32640/g.59189 Transcript_32640/m.59189 type:complete len:82 (+) Transcript_32640:217-462(+)